MWNPHVMILTASYGDGHLQVSNALKQRLAQYGIKNVQIVDLMKEAHPLLNSISTKLYLKSTVTSQYGLDYYGWSYYVTRDTRTDGSIGKYFNYLGKRKLKALIEQTRPDVIISTFPFGAAADIGRELGIPACVVITDYALHMRWTHPDTDRYYVATEELKTELLLKRAATAERVKVTGIPIRPAFLEASASGCRYLPGWNPSKRLVLISAGSYGVLHHIEELADRLRHQDHCDVAIVCGRNQKMENKLKQLFAGNEGVHVFGYVEHIHELMALSTCIVTKAGGITLSEALALKLPVFIYKPFAGQEKENAKYFAEMGMAHVAANIHELEEQLHRFLSDSAVAYGMKSRMAAVHKGDAADLIVKDVLSMVSLEREKLASV
ncbi:glycosyltransferase [Paenibacillus chartarius]|uniref:Glycosyltransferase n=1 Tax=Paenibacillus chartarius TaxID=747481 RepID=A0ABV6DR64_9BACL